MCEASDRMHKISCCFLKKSNFFIYLLITMRAFLGVIFNNLTIGPQMDSQMYATNHHIWINANANPVSLNKYSCFLFLTNVDIVAIIILVGLLTLLSLYSENYGLTCNK